MLTPRRPLHVIATVLTLLSIFQLALIFGAPWGNAAWGGQHQVLPINLRVGSAVSILIYALIFWLARKRLAKPEAKGFRIACWVVVIYFSFGVLLNVASSSPWERYGMSVVALALAWAFFRIAVKKASRS